MTNSARFDAERWKAAWAEHRRRVRADERRERCTPACTTQIAAIFEADADADVAWPHESSADENRRS